MLAVALRRGVHSYLWPPVVSAPGSPTPATYSELSTPSPEFSPKPTGLSRSYAAVLQVIGSSLGWELGAVWETGPGDDLLRCVRTWHAGAGAPEFEMLSERIILTPGEGLPGRVVESGEPAWIVDAPEDRNFPRAAIARRSGLHAAFGFPLLSPRGVVGMMEFFTRDLRQPDERLLDTMRDLGSQVGQYVARRHAEEAVRASESQLRAMLEAALDAVVTMDHTGRVIGMEPRR